MNYQLYLVTDERYPNLLERVEKALQKGVTLVQYRAKHKSQSDQIEEAKILKALCDKHHVPLLINDNVQVALAVDAAGVHLGQEDLDCATARRLLGPEKIIGISAHDVPEALRAQAAGADYIGAGAVFPTNTKLDVDTMGLEKLQEICQAVTIPVVAIGGVTFENKQKCFDVGAKGVAMVTALLGEM